MIKQFLTYNELNEALKLSQYRDYHGIRPEGIEDKLSELFKGKNRIYIPFEYKVTKENIKPNENILQTLKKEGYEITDYLEGYCEKDGRTFRIGKILNKLNRLDLLKTFNEDPNRAVQNKNFLICISKHPYDIAGMSTDRGWTSCMNLRGGSKNYDIFYEIEEGTVIAYLIDVNDKNINHPYGRINIKPYRNQKNDIAWGLASKCYGSIINYIETITEEFMKTIQEWVDMNLNIKGKGVYDLSTNVYNEAPASIFIGDKKNKEYKIFKWGINLDYFRESDGIYNGDMVAPKDIVEFKGFKEELGLDIKNLRGNLDFDGCTSLTSISNLPEYVGGHLSFRSCENLKEMYDLPKTVAKSLSFSNCMSLKIISKLPSYIGYDIGVVGCPFFKKDTEHEIRKKHNIEPIYRIAESSFNLNPKYVKNGVLDYNHDMYIYDIRMDSTFSVRNHFKKFKGFEDFLGVEVKELRIDFDVFNDYIEELTNFPKKMRNLKIIECRNLTKLEGLPEEVDDLRIMECYGLKSLPNLPKKINGSLYIEDLEYLERIGTMPEYVKGKIVIYNNASVLGTISEEDFREKYNVEKI